MKGRRAIVAYKTIRCGAEKSTARVNMTVNEVNVHRQNLSMTIAAYFHSPVSSERSSSARIFSVTVWSSPRIASSRLCARQVPPAVPAEPAAAEAAALMPS